MLTVLTEEIRNKDMEMTTKNEEVEALTNKRVAEWLGWVFFSYVDGGPEYYRTPSRIVALVEFLPDFKGSIDVAMLWVVPELVKFYDDKRFPNRRVSKLIERALDEDRNPATVLCEDLGAWMEK